MDASGTQSVVIDWGIADSAELGTEESKKSQSRLADIAGKLASLPVSSDLAALGVVGLTTEATQISSISELNFQSTEETSCNKLLIF